MNSTSLIQNFLALKPAKPLIVILGCTASGKTGLSIQCALELRQAGLRPEIINADSRQFYTFLDIGTAKITQSETQDIPHHLLSVLDPKDDCSIAWFQREATLVIDRLHTEKKMPMLVGGSMLYLSSIIDGLCPVGADPELRVRLSKEYDADAGEALWERLRNIDPESADAIPRQNKAYLLRALEIFESTGVPKSKQMKTSMCPYDLLIIGIERGPDDLRDRINRRTADMLQNGWIDEVRGLIDRGYTEGDPGMKSHGYREIMHHLVETPRRDVSTLAEEISANVRKYAKRQRTWWRRDKRIRWITPQEYSQAPGAYPQSAL